jgi:chromatin segregation and condensation protein Rec8/ScpA/Scc1 (kleisin family)
MRNLDIADTRAKLEIYARQGMLTAGHVRLVGELSPGGAQAISSAPQSNVDAEESLDRAAMEQVAALAHREKLPETTAALSQFLLQWPASLAWVGFDGLVEAWAAVAPADLDCDRVGVFWALLFLSAQGKLELQQEGGLFGSLRLRRLSEVETAAALPILSGQGPDGGPALEAQAA